MPLLNCSAITKQFGGLTALKNVSISIDTGEICGLIGPNGAGKTTLFNIISGSIHPSGGEVKFKNKKITHKSLHSICNLGIARSFQTPRPFESMSVRENVAVGQHFGSRQPDRSTIDEVFNLMDLNDYADNSPSDLTMAQRKRLDLCRALSTNPNLLLLDEIMAGLNPSETQKFLVLIREISKNRGVILIEHDIEAVMNISDRVVVLNSGEKIADGPPHEIASNQDVIDAYLGTSELEDD